MSSRSEYNDRQGERPILPPIKDLLRELDTPHDPPSMTLARLRVSDEDRQSYLVGSSLRGSYPSSSHPQNHLKASDSHQHYDSRYNYNNPPPPLFHAHSTELGSRYSPAVQPFPGYPEHRRRESYATNGPINNMRPYTPQSWTPEHHHLDTVQKLPGGSGASQNMSTMHFLPLSSMDVPRFVPRHRPQELYTNFPPSRSGEDEQTPLARHHNPDPRNMSYAQLTSEDNSAVGPMKYECSYCGKGFNRPSSLKIHLNSHTGEKPFVCPVESCGRSFSVLSNMRRHARVHTQSPMKLLGPASDDESKQTSSIVASRHGASSNHIINTDTLIAKWHHRRASSASTSSTSSQRSHSNSSEDELENASSRPEKRTRRHLK